MSLSYEWTVKRLTQNEMKCLCKEDSPLDDTLKSMYRQKLRNSEQLKATFALHTPDVVQNESSCTLEEYSQQALGSSSNEGSKL